MKTQCRLKRYSDNYCSLGNMRVAKFLSDRVSRKMVECPSQQTNNHPQHWKAQYGVLYVILLYVILYANK